MSLTYVEQINWDHKKKKFVVYECVKGCNVEDFFNLVSTRLKNDSYSSEVLIRSIIHQIAKIIKELE